ncbi:MAG TPA: M48 family metalloprotease [Tepidisphaeraceae bacterium]
MTPTSSITTENSAPPPSGGASAAIPVNDLARSYQPRRVWAAGISIGWNLLLAVLFVFTGAGERLYKHFVPQDPAYFPPSFAWIAPVYFSILFAGYALLNFPLELWFGYLEERQFGLAKDGVRAWARDWLIGTTQHGVMFLIGCCLLLVFQLIAPHTWLVWSAGTLLILFLGTTWLAADLIPLGLFTLERADAATVARLTRLSGPLPPVVVYSHSGLREFAGGIVGLGSRQVMLVSRATVELASDTLLRFVLLHDLGHRRYHHNLLAALAGWAWVVIGLAVGDHVIPARWGHDTAVFGSPLYVAFLTLILSAWMAIGEPVLAYLGRRLEYQADRFYLRNGGTLDQMRAALDQLAHQNLARTEAMRRRETIFHPLPSVYNRLYAARQYQERTQGA